MADRVHIGGRVKRALLLLALTACASDHDLPPAQMDVKCMRDGDTCAQRNFGEVDTGICRPSDGGVECCWGCWDGAACQSGMAAPTCGRAGEMCSPDNC